MFFLQPRQVSVGSSATGQGPSVLAWTSIEQSGTAARSGEKNTVGNTVAGHGSRCPVRGKEAGIALHSDAREPSGSWCRPIPERLVVARACQHHLRNRRRAGNSHHLLFWSSSLEGALLGWFSASRNARKEVLLQGSSDALAYQSSDSSRGILPTTALRRRCRSWLNAMTSRVANLIVLDSDAYKGQGGPKKLQSNALVCLQPKSKKEDKEAENDLHVGGLRRPSQTVFGSRLGINWTPAVGLHWHRTRQRHRCNQTHAFVRASRFPGSTVKACQKRFEEQFEKSSLWSQPQPPSRLLGCPTTFEWISFVE